MTYRDRLTIETRQQIEWDGSQFVRKGTIDTVSCKRCGALIKEISTPYGHMPQVYLSDEIAASACPKCDPA